MNRNEIRLDRDLNSYVTFGEGPHQCLGKDLATLHARTILKVLASMRNLRRSPGDPGNLKSITKPGGFKLYMNPEWSDFTPYPTSKPIGNSTRGSRANEFTAMKLMFDGGLEDPRWNPEDR